MSDDDAELVALIDNELDEGRRTALLARLADDGSRQRYGELWQTSARLPPPSTFCSSKLRSLVCGLPFPLMSRFGGCQGVSLELLSESWPRVLL
jgi:hypothetical protein